MRTRSFCFVLSVVGAAALMGVGVANLSPGAGASQADETKMPAPRVVLAVRCVAMSADRNLLFGILALQMDFISRDDLNAQRVAGPARRPGCATGPGILRRSSR
jgi:hypothetical protein